MAQDKYFTKEWQEFADSLCDQHNIKRVKIVMNARISQFGVARLHSYNDEPRVITLRPTFDDDQMTDTLRHEIAHWMAFDNFGCRDHGKVWKECAVTLGADPSQYREVTSDNAAQFGYIIYTCGRGCEWYRHRRSYRFDNGFCPAHQLPIFIRKGD